MKNSVWCDVCGGQYDTDDPCLFVSHLKIWTWCHYCRWRKCIQGSGGAGPYWNDEATLECRRQRKAHKVLNG